MVTLAILPTTSRPDLVILNRLYKKIYLLELTCCFEKNIKSANTRKMLRYNSLKTDLTERGYECHLKPFEVRSRGYVSKSNRTNLMSGFLMNKLKPNVFKCISGMSKISLLYFS